MVSVDQNAKCWPMILTTNTNHSCPMTLEKQQLEHRVGLMELSNGDHQPDVLTIAIQWPFDISSCLVDILYHSSYMLQ